VSEVEAVTLTREDPELERPLEDEEQLLAYFRVAEKPPSAFRVGTEHEKFALYAATGLPVPYEGDRGIAAIFAELRERYGFDVFLEGENIVGLERDGGAITLEPGGQFELSGAPFHTLHETCSEFHAHLDLIKQVSDRFGISWVGLGIQPLVDVDDVPRMPRERHREMRSHFARHGGRLAPYMMHASCGVQANFDFSDELDAGRKLRAGNAASPIVTALYANSSLSLGKPNGYETFRAQVWRETDPARCGFLKAAFEEDFFERGAYHAYLEWALDVPVMFLVRGGRYRPIGTRTFRELFEAGEKLTLADWNLHLTTLFPEVRLKRVIEVRGADTGSPGTVCALPALWKGLLYDATSLDAVLARLAHWTWSDVDAIHAQVARSGLSAATPDGPVREVGLELLEIAAAGLRRSGARNSSGETEEIFLQPLFEIARGGASPGRQLLAEWDGPLQQRIERLVARCAY
jgi:glutamate--cysteine ligase